MLADRDLEIDVMKEIAAKKMVIAQARREQVGFAVSRGQSQRRACALLSVARSAVKYTSKMLEKDAPVLAAMCTLSAQYPRFGYIDEFTKVSLAIDVAGSIRSGRVVEVLSKLVSQHGAPRYFRSDNELNAMGLVQKEQIQPLTANRSQKNNSVTLTLKPVVTSTNQTGHRFTIMNTRSDSETLRSSPNLKQSDAQWKVRTLSTGSYRPQRPHREGSIHWAKLQSNPDTGYRI